MPASPMCPTYPVSSAIMPRAQTAMYASAIHPSRTRQPSNDCARINRGALGSGAFLDLARADASRADQHSPHVAVHFRAHFLQVGIPAPLGLVVGVADVVAD